MDNKKLLYKQLNALRLEVDGSIVDAIKKTVDELFAPAPEAVGEERRGMKHGIYYLHWKSGGKSIAAVGYDRSGNNWFAPCNWISGVWKDWSSVESAELLFENDYSNDNELKASDPRWRGEQHCKCQQLINSEPVTFLLQNALRNLNEEQRIALRDALIERTSNIPCCARWVSGTPDDEDLHPIKYGSKLQFMAAGFYSNNRWHINGDTVVLEKNTPVQYLDESPCTCQQVILPTREEAEKWANKETQCGFDGNTPLFDAPARRLALSMYDWIAQQLNRNK